MLCILFSVKHLAGGPRHIVLSRFCRLNQYAMWVRCFAQDITYMPFPCIEPRTYRFKFRRSTTWPFLLLHDLGVPRFPDIDDLLEEDIRELERVAGIFKLSHLQTICKNIISEQEFLNPSIGTYLNDETGAKMKQLFFNQPDRADVVFNVEG